MTLSTILRVASGHLKVAVTVNLVKTPIASWESKKDRLTLWKQEYSSKDDPRRNKVTYSYQGSGSSGGVRADNDKDAIKEVESEVLPRHPKLKRVKTAYIQPDKDDGDLQIKKGIAAIKKGLVQAEKAADSLKSLEKDANEHRKIVLDTIEEFISVLEKLDLKKVGPFLAEAKSSLPGARSAKWSEYLSGGGPSIGFIRAVGDLPRKLRAWVTKNKASLGDLEKFYSVALKKYSKSSSDLYERVKGLETVVDKAWAEVEYFDILVPHGAQGIHVPAMEAYKDIFNDVRLFSSSPNIYMDKAEERYAGFVESLKEMLKLLEDMLKETEKRLLKPKVEGEFYAEYDDNVEAWCVFHTDKGNGKAYRSFGSRAEAVEAAKQMTQDSQEHGLDSYSNETAETILQDWNNARTRSARNRGRST